MYDPSGYRWGSARQSENNKMLLPVVSALLERHVQGASNRVVDLGCGNGACTSLLAQAGWDVVGVEPSKEGFQLAREAHPSLHFHQATADDDLAGKLGTFDAVVSLDVIEHVYLPRDFVRCVRTLMKPTGVAIISTPYHGYLKNLALAVSGKMDAHFTALMDHGHIKFFSARTIKALLSEANLQIVDFVRVGRIPPLAKSMIIVAKRSPD